MSDETAAAPASAPTARRRRGALTFLRDVVVILLIALVVSFLVKTFVVRSFYIPSASMSYIPPTREQPRPKVDGDVIVISEKRSAD